MQNLSRDDLLRLLKEGNPALLNTTTRPTLLSIEWETGGHMLFYYNYLMAAGRWPDEPPETMALYFTSQTVRLKGIRLDGLIQQFETCEPSCIYVGNERYIAHDMNNQPIVLSAVLEEKRK
ncbi:MAG: hypothetical protein JST39_20555 [Bacteroidetes bacterium]|nr:hypothetical protein [Bacteroidota bacterium]